MQIPSEEIRKKIMEAVLYNKIPIRINVNSTGIINGKTRQYCLILKHTRYEIFMKQLF